MTCARCEDLQAEVEFLKGELGLRVTAAQVETVQRALGLPPSRSRLLLALFAAKGRLLTHAQALDAMPPKYGDDERGFDNVKSHICRLRAQFGADLIVNVWGSGYRLTEAGCERVANVLASS